MTGDEPSGGDAPTEDPPPDDGSAAAAPPEETDSTPDHDPSAGAESTADASDVDESSSEDLRDRIGEMTRRDALKVGGGALLVGGGLLAAENALDNLPGAFESEQNRALAERFAPTLHFGAGERWFPTDPRPYASDRDGERVVHGFDALNDYSKEFREAGDPPRPTVFYQVLSEQESDLSVVQFWIYSAFDQFTTNFHWHDWELLQVFADTSGEAATPVLLVASSHSRKIPNNEFLDPDPDTNIRLLSEVGSHSSATDVNGRSPSFQRFEVAGALPDVTNDAVSLVDRIGDFPVAYGLPRGEGGHLPYAMPELDDTLLYEHEALPDVRREDFVPAEMTVRSFQELVAPPTQIPEREAGLTFAPKADVQTDVAADVEYALEPIDPLTEAIEDFVGPQLSFEFSIPTAVEDQFAGHITTTGSPWTQPRFSNPIADVSDERHLDALRDRFTLSGEIDRDLGSRIVGAVESLTAGTDGRVPGVEGTEETYADEIDVSRGETEVEAAVLLQSEEPAATVTARGVLQLVDVEPAEHRLTVNAAGYAPYGEEFAHEGGLRGAGAEGNVPLVPKAEAVKVTGDLRENDASLREVRIDEDFAGTTFAGRPPGDDRFGVYVHRSGRYSLRVRDENDDEAAFRIDPDDGDQTVDVGSVRTGKRSLIRFLEEYLVDTAEINADYPPDRDDDDSYWNTEFYFRTAATAAGDALAAAESGNTAEVEDNLKRARRLLAVALEQLRGAEETDENRAEVRHLLGRAERAADVIEQALDAPLQSDSG